MRSAVVLSGAATLVLVAVASASAWRDGSPVVPTDGSHAPEGTAWPFLVLLVGALVAYLAGLVAVRRGAPVRVVLVLGAAIQLVPLAAPLLLSTDAWTYWGYGWIASDGGGNPYVDPPADFPQSPAAAYVGADWRDTTTVYGPVFTLLSEPVALLAGSSADAAAWLFKGLAAAAVLVAAAAVARAAARPALAVGARRLEPGARDPPRRRRSQRRARRRARRAGRRAGGAPPCGPRRRRVDARDRGEVGARPVPRGRRPRCPPARETHGAGGGRGDRRRRRSGRHPALRPRLAAGLRAARGERGARDELRAAFAARAARAPPRRLASASRLAAAAAGLAWIARDAWRGVPRHGRAACLVLATTPYLAVWYLAWAVPLAAVDEDRVARVAALALTAYLLPQTIPL